MPLQDPNTFHGLRLLDTGSAPSTTRPKAGQNLRRCRLRFMLRTGHSLAPQKRASSFRFDDEDLSCRREPATGDPGISPDRTHTGKPP